MTETTDIEPFEIRVPEAALDDLRQRLLNTRWPDEADAEPWRYGPPVTYMRHFVSSWLERHDWRAQEASLNRLPQFTTSIRGNRVHFVHQRGSGPDPIPLIMTHGWPGSFIEMLRILPLLTNPGDHGGDPKDAFSVVVPSIPGHGFSGRPTSPHVNYSVVADMWVELMERLDYARFGAQGGDWGSWISAALAQQHPQSVLGLHLNYLSTRFRPGLGSADTPLNADELGYLDRVANWADHEGGYIAIQGTKPLSLSYGLTDSPAGLAAWLIEKFRSWSDCADLPEDAIPLEALITDVMIYWITETAHSAARFYAASKARPFHLAPGDRISPPCGVAVLPRELPMPPRSWAERAFNVVHWSKLPRGGHFAALEQPQLLAEDIRAFFRPLR